MRALSPDRAENRFTTTDVKGRFELRDLGPGHWTVAAFKSGFVMQWFREWQASSRAEPIELTHESWILELLKNSQSMKVNSPKNAMKR